MQIILRWFHLTCRDTGGLISESLDHRLSFFQRMKLKIHLTMCRVCKVYLEQLKLIQKTARELSGENPFPLKDTHLSEESKERIKQSLLSP